jgi:hypothetical protein
LTQLLLEVGVSNSHMMQVMEDYLEWSLHLITFWWLHLLEDMLRNPIYLSPAILRLAVINLLYEIMSLICKLLLGSLIGCIHCCQSSRFECMNINQLHGYMIHSSLDLLESTSGWLMASDVYFILYKLKKTHWIEASKATFKHDIIFWLLLLFLLETDLLHLYLFQEVIISLLACLN